MTLPVWCGKRCLGCTDPKANKHFGVAVKCRVRPCGAPAARCQSLPKREADFTTENRWPVLLEWDDRQSHAAATLRHPHTLGHAVCTACLDATQHQNINMWQLHLDSHKKSPPKGFVQELSWLTRMVKSAQVLLSSDAANKLHSLDTQNIREIRGVLI